MSSVEQYIARLPDDRRAAIAKVRDVINANLPTGYEETIQWGMISWCVPESKLPANEVYNKQPLCLAGLASQKNHMAVYLLSVYGDKALRGWFESAYKQTGKRLDMGQSCVRFKSLDALPLEVIGEAVSKVTVDKYVEVYRNVRSSMQKGSAKKSSAKKSSAKKSSARKPATKKSTKKPTAKQRTKR